ncbi:bifunctional oligoribonuclease/PAP phosphatase NrnA [bacterium]|nr:bifunctional oligoribonuclease/PAP phosphatase NrnA [bacterium]
MEVYQTILNEIEKAEKILLISHINPDGDTLGSMCAMKLFIGDKADMLVQTRADGDIPQIYKFLPLINSAKTLRNVQNIYDLVITLDVAAIDRMVLMGRKIFESAKTTINIDHHETNPNYATINHVCPHASSCGEILFDFFKGINFELTKDIADSLFVSVMTDTGGFRYDNTSAKTFEIAGDLIRYGANPALLAQNVYDSKDKNMVLFQAYCVNNTIFEEQNKVAIVKITNEDMHKFSARHEYTEGIAELLRGINNVEVAAVMKENDNNSIKVSLRSKNIDLTKVTEKFKGGGHQKSAGCNIYATMDIAYKQLLEAIKQEL